MQLHTHTHTHTSTAKDINHQTSFTSFGRHSFKFTRMNAPMFFVPECHQTKVWLQRNEKSVQDHNGGNASTTIPK